MDAKKGRQKKAHNMKVVKADRQSQEAELRRRLMGLRMNAGLSAKQPQAQFENLLQILRNGDGKSEIVLEFA